MENNNLDDGIIKPLYVPAEHDPKASLEERAVYALAYIGSGTAKEIMAKLNELGDPDATESQVAQLLENLFDKGLINGSKNGKMRIYDLSKVTRPHRGKVV